MTTQTNHRMFVPEGGGILTNNQVNRLLHVLRIGKAQLEQDTKTFIDASNGPDTPLYTAEAMGGMAKEFERYVTEAGDLIDLIEANTEYGSLNLVLASWDIEGCELLNPEEVF